MFGLDRNLRPWVLTMPLRSWRCSPPLKWSTQDAQVSNSPHRCWVCLSPSALLGCRSMMILPPRVHRCFLVSSLRFFNFRLLIIEWCQVGEWMKSCFVRPNAPVYILSTVPKRKHPVRAADLLPTRYLMLFSRYSSYKGRIGIFVTGMLSSIHKCL